MKFRGYKATLRIWNTLGLGASALAMFSCADAGPGDDPALGRVSEPIVNGRKATMAEVRSYNNAIVSVNNEGCTGLLVAPRLVLSAAHCAIRANTVIKFRYYDDAGTEYTKAVKTVAKINHPDHVPGKGGGGPDIGFYLLEHPVHVAKPYWNPFATTDNNLNNESMEVYGHGNNANRDLEKMWDCGVYGTSPYLFSKFGVPYWRARYKCTSPQSTTQGESGDSGAPVFNEDGEMVAVNIGSYNSGTGNIGMYFAHTESDGSRPYIEWLEGQMDALRTKAVIGDFNGDGLGDIAYADEQGLAKGWVDVSERNPVQRFPNGTRIDTFKACEGSLQAGDFNNDGIDDLLCYMPDLTPTVPFVGVKYGHSEGNGSAEDTFEGDDSWTVFESIADKCYSVHIGDFDGANGDDLFCRRRDGGGRAAYLNVGPHPGTISHFNDQPEYSSSLRWCGQQLFVGDFDGNGKDDLLCYNAGTAMYFRFSRGGAMSYRYTARTAHTDWCSGTLRVGDLNADGITDLFCRDDSTNDYKVLLSKGVARSLESFDFENDDYTGSLGGWCDAAGRSLFMYPFSADGSADLICSQEDENKFWIEYKRSNFFNGVTNYRAPNLSNYL